MSAEARLFVAVDLPPGVRAELARWARWALAPGEATSAAGGRGGRAGTRTPRPGRGPNDGVRRVEADALHVTLCFLGDQPLDTVEEIADVVEEAVAGYAWGGAVGDRSGGGAVGDRSVGGGTVGGGTVGPLSIGAPVWLPPRRPRALALEVHDESGGLAALYESLRDGLGAAIGWVPERRRFRPHVTVARLRPWAPPPACVEPTPALAFEPESVTVYRSRLAREGAEYQALARVNLRGSDAGATERLP